MQNLKCYIEAAVLTGLYFLIIHFVYLNFGYPKTGILKILMYPYQLISQPIVEGEITIEVINRMAFTIYFCWATCCVYLSLIKNLLQQFSIEKK